jgi:hypothetical protein
VALTVTAQRGATPEGPATVVEAPPHPAAAAATTIEKDTKKGRRFQRIVITGGRKCPT